MTAAKKISGQGTLTFRTWGGRREGAGRPAGKGRRAAPHRKRIRLKSYEPQHTTLRLSDDLRNSRRWKVFAEIVESVRAAQRDGFRIVEFTLQDGHLHLITESNGWKALSSGVRGLSIRIARRLNRVLGRTGQVIADRYHSRGLGTPREVRNALVYVLQNAKKHLASVAKNPLWIDPLSSAAFFRGWSGEAEEVLTAARDRWKKAGVHADNPCKEPRSWLLRAGWKKHGLLRIAEVPVS
jgi:putative transposase